MIRRASTALMVALLATLALVGTAAENAAEAQEMNCADDAPPTSPNAFLIFEALDDCNVLLNAKTTLEGPNPTAPLNWSAGVDFNTWTGVELNASLRVEQIDLNNSGLTGSIPASFGDLEALARLYLGGNELTGAIPPELGELRPSMTELNLSGNNLTGPIPAELETWACCKTCV